MSQVTVSQLAEVLGISVEKLIAQMGKADINLTSGDAPVSNDDKKKLLAHLRSSHGKSESDATAPRKVTLKRKSVSELRIQGSGPRAATKTVNVEFRKRRTYVKREALEAQGSRGAEAPRDRGEETARGRGGRAQGGRGSRAQGSRGRGQEGPGRAIPA